MVENTKLVSRTIEKHKKLYYKIAYTYVRNHEDTEDVLHNAFEKAYLMHAQVEHLTKLKSWLATIVKNEANQLIRRQRLSEQKLKEMTLKDPADYLDTMASRMDLKSALRQLSEEQRDLVVMKYLLGYKQREVSRILNMPLGTVKSKTSRAIDSLRVILGGDFSDQ